MPAERRPYNPGEPTLCDLCDVKFCSLKIHKKVFHGGKKEVKCLFCGIPFMGTTSLTKHLKLDLHADSSDLFCCVCLATTFKTIVSLSSHLQTHLELHSFFCAKCKRTFCSKLGLLSHDCSSLTLTPSPPVGVSGTMERDLTVKGLPRPEDVVTNRIPDDMISAVEVSEKPVSSERAPKPKVIFMSPRITRGRRHCAFSAATAVNEIKIYHSDAEPPSSAESLPSKVLNPSNVPADIKTAGDGPQVPNSSKTPSIAGKGTLPDNTCKSKETPSFELQVFPKNQDCSTATLDERLSSKLLIRESCNLPIENGSHSLPAGKCQENFQRGEETFPPNSSKTSSMVIENDHRDKSDLPITTNCVNSLEETHHAQIFGSSGSVPRTEDMCSSKIPEADIPNTQTAILMLEDGQTTPLSIEVDGKATSLVTPSQKPIVPVSESTEACLGNQPKLHPSTQTPNTPGVEPEKMIIPTDDMNKESFPGQTSLGNPTPSILHEGMAPDVVLDAKPDLPKRDAKEEKATLISECMATCQDQEPAAGQDQEPPAGQEQDRRVGQNQKPPKLIIEASADTVDDAGEWLTSITRRRHQTRRAVCEAFNGNSVIPESNKNSCKSEQMRVSKNEMKERPCTLSMEDPFVSRLHENHVLAAVAERINGAEPVLMQEFGTDVDLGSRGLSGDIPFSQDLVPPQPSLQQSDGKAAASTVDAVADAVEYPRRITRREHQLPKCISRQRRKTRRITVAQGISRGSVAKRKMYDSSVNESEIMQNENRRISVSKEGTNGCLPGPASLYCPAAPQSLGSSIVERIAEHNTDRVVPDLIEEELKANGCIPENTKTSCKSEQMPISKNEMKEGPCTLSIENPVVSRLYQNGVLAAVSGRINGAEPGLIQEDGTDLDSGSRGLSAHTIFIEEQVPPQPSLQQSDCKAAESAVHTIANAQEPPRRITLRKHQPQRVTTAFGLSNASTKTPKILKFCKSEAEKICIPKEEAKQDLPGPISLENSVSPQFHGNNITKATVNLQSSVEASDAPPVSHEQEPPKQILQNANCDDVKSTLDTAELHNCILRQRRRTRRITVAQGISRRSVTTRKIAGSNMNKSETMQNENQLISVPKDGGLPDPVSLCYPPIPRSLESSVVDRIADHNTDTVPDLINKGPNANGDIETNQQPPQQLLDCKAVKALAAAEAAEADAPPVSHEEEPPKQTLQNENCDDVKSTVDTEELPNCILRQRRRTRRVTVAQGISRGSATTRKIAGSNMNKSEIMQNENQRFSVSKDRTNEGLADPVSLCCRTTPGSLKSIIVERIADHNTDTVPGLINEGPNANGVIETNQQPPQQLLLDCKAVKTSAAAEADDTAVSRRGCKTRRLTTVHGMSPAKKIKKSKRGRSLGDSQNMSVLQNEIKEELVDDMHLKNALRPYGSGIVERVAEHNTDAITQTPMHLIEENAKATCDSGNNQLPLQQLAFETKAAAESVPTAFNRRGRKTRRLTTVPKLSAPSKNLTNLNGSLDMPKETLSSQDKARESLLSTSLENPATRLPKVEGMAAPPGFIKEDVTEKSLLVLENGAMLPDSPPHGQDKEPPEHNAVALDQAADARPAPKRRRRNTRRLTTVYEEGHEEPEETLLTDTLVDIADKSSRRALRRRRLTERAENVGPLEISNSENVFPSSQSELPSTGLPGNSDPTLPDASVSKKKKRISFNETIECWNPILQELTWRGICDDVRGEVPLLKPVPKSKRAKKAHESKKKARRRSKLGIVGENVPGDAEVVEIDGICVPKSLKTPENLRPVLKPSPVLVTPPTNVVEQLETDTPRRRYAQRRLVLKNMAKLEEKYGADFSYERCLKVDGRFHCPDGDCMDNDHRGYSNTKVLRNHIKTNHIDVECPTCNVCGKTFATSSKLREHVVVHSNILPHPCKYCDKRFKTAALLKQHAGTHCGCGECFYCGKAFSSKRTLMNHFRDTPYRCNCCEISLWCPAMFAEHEKQIEHLYTCFVCPRQYRTHRAAERHVRDVHYDKTTAIDGRYQCRSCERKFTSWKNIYRHMRRRHDFVSPAISSSTNNP